MTRSPRDKNIFSRISKSLFRRQLYFISRPLRRLRGRIRYSIYRVLPYPVRRFFPMLERQSFSTLREKVKQKIKQRQEAEAEQREKLILEQPEREASEEVRQARLQRIPQVNSGYSNYSCVYGEPLDCHYAQETTQTNPQAKYCQKCRFPAVLPFNGEIIGRKGRYQITNYIGRRGRGRLYTGIDMSTEEFVAIKEYLFPKKHFNAQETRQARKIFENQGSFDLSDGRRQDLRLPLDADTVSDRRDFERCYFITNEINNLPTLRQYLAQYGRMNAPLVREVLNQILQILESLHYHKFRFSTGKIHDHLAHGNLNLDSILISFDKRPFFVRMPVSIYLTDLSLWEDLFVPPPYNPGVGELQNDLVALGYIAFNLLVGTSVDAQNKLLNPRKESNWHTDDLALKNYIFRLLKLKKPFPDVFAARKALLNLPHPTLLTTVIPTEVETSTTKKKTPWWVWLIITTLLLLLLIQLVSWLTNRRPVVASQTSQPTICCVSQITATPRGIFDYSSPRNGSWNYALTQKNLIIKNETLEQELDKKLPRSFRVQYSPSDTETNILSQVANQNLDFAISSVDNVNDNNQDNTRIRNLGEDTFAYDGIAVFIAFGYNTGDKRLLASLNGSITIEQLRQLYTGQVDNWQAFGGPNLPVKLYIPENEEVIQIFEQQVLGNQGDINLFRSLLPEPVSNDNTSIATDPQEASQINILPIFRMLRTILQEFEDEQIGGIGFAPVSKVFGQCAVYPLAIAENQVQSIQPFIQDNNEAIDINLDLCKAKGNYHPHTEVFQTRQYPLAYPLKVIYPRDNNLPPAGEKFAEILKTKEVQQMIAKTGLVPSEKLD